MSQRGRLVLLLSAAVAAGVAALSLSSLAFAHSRPIRFDPPPGAVLSTAPAKIDGWFGSELRRDPNWNFIHVTDAQGARVDTGDATLSSDRRQMTATLKPGLAPGMYLVTWRTWDDADGEIFGDCLTLFVGQAAADAAVAAKTRLDGGSKCERIEISAKSGTPTPEKVSAVATAAVTAEASDDEDSHSDSEGGESGGIPIWGLAIGIVAGVVVGGLGGKFLAQRPSS